MSDAESLNRARQLLLDRVNREYEAFKEAMAPASDPISAVLRTHLFTEQVLEAHIRSWLPRPEDLLGQRLPYRVKLELAGAFGAIMGHILQALRALNRVRNDLAHKIDHDISEDDINSIGTPLGDGFAKIKAEHSGDLGTQLGKLLPYLAGLLVAQMQGPLANEDPDTPKARDGGKLKPRGK